MDVKVVAEAGSSGIEWTIDGKKPQESVISLGHKAGAQTLDFKLNDHSGRNLRFDSSDPIWVHEDDGGQCPGAGIASDQISVASCDDKKLSITDANSGAPRTLHYQLNFVDGSGSRVPVDPVIKNGGSLL